MYVNNRSYQKLIDADIVKVIGHYLGKGSLRKKGRYNQRFLCLCPFHKEETPSFTIFPKSNSFCCYGCGQGGDMVRFVCLYENVEVHEALKEISKITGIPMYRNRKVSPARARRRNRGKTRELRKERNAREKYGNAWNVPF